MYVWLPLGCLPILKGYAWTNVNCDWQSQHLLALYHSTLAHIIADVTYICPGDKYFCFDHKILRLWPWIKQILLQPPNVALMFMRALKLSWFNWQYAFSLKCQRRTDWGGEGSIWISQWGIHQGQLHREGEHDVIHCVWLGIFSNLYIRCKRQRRSSSTSFVPTMHFTGPQCLSQREAPSVTVSMSSQLQSMTTCTYCTWFCTQQAGCKDREQPNAGWFVG